MSSTQMEQLGRGSHNPLEVTLSEPSDLALLIGHVLGELPPHPSGSRVASLSFLLDYLRKGGVSVGEVAPEVRDRAYGIIFCDALRKTWPR